MDSLRKLSGYILAINIVGASTIFSVGQYRTQIPDTYKQTTHSSVEHVVDATLAPKTQSIDTYCIADSAQYTNSASGLIR